MEEVAARQAGESQAQAVRLHEEAGRARGEEARLAQDAAEGAARTESLERQLAERATREELLPLQASVEAQRAELAQRTGLLAERCESLQAATQAGQARGEEGPSTPSSLRRIVAGFSAPDQAHRLSLSGHRTALECGVVTHGC